jgi:hypothetical protein
LKIKAWFRRRGVWRHEHPQRKQSSEITADAVYHHHQQQHDSQHTNANTNTTTTTATHVQSSPPSPLTTHRSAHYSLFEKTVLKRPTLTSSGHESPFIGMNIIVLRFPLPSDCFVLECPLPSDYFVLEYPLPADYFVLECLLPAGYLY